MRDEELSMATTAEDVWQLLAELATAQKETDRQIKEQKQENDRRQQENDRRQQENDRRQQENDRRQQENDQRQQETDRRQRETDRQLKELGKQIGGLGAKFGSFTEGLALPSMETILRERFGMEIISPSVRVSKEGQQMEIDVLAYANGSINSAYIVEVKSHPREDSIMQLKSILQRFRLFFPEHKDKQLYGILAAVDLSSELRSKILQEGLYVARIHDQVFELDIPENFQPQTF